MLLEVIKYYELFFSSQVHYSDFLEVEMDAIKVAISKRGNIWS